MNNEKLKIVVSALKLISDHQLSDNFDFSDNFIHIARNALELFYKVSFNEIFNNNIFTYRDMLKVLQLMPDEQLDQSITIEDEFEQECIPAKLGILDSDHLVIRYR